MKFITKQDVLKRYGFSEQTYGLLKNQNVLKVDCLKIIGCGKGKYKQDIVSMDALKQFEENRCEFPDLYQFKENEKFIQLKYAMDKLGYSTKIGYDSVGLQVKQILNPVDYGTKGHCFKMVRRDLLKDAIAYRLKYQLNNNVKEIEEQQIEQPKLIEEDLENIQEILAKQAKNKNMSMETLISKIATLASQL